VYVLDRDPIDASQYDDVMWPGWYENYSGGRDSPQTKVCNYLRENVGVEPDPELLSYTINTSEAARLRSSEYLRLIAGEPVNGRFPVVAIHYEGNTSCERKNLSHETARRLCEAVLEQGYVPMVLDWDFRSPCPDHRRIHCPFVHQGDLWGGTGTGDAETLAALIEQCVLMIGVDSGPLHVAGATTTVITRFSSSICVRT
jgi:ADP-heptose:LPS heptosyltransferase